MDRFEGMVVKRKRSEDEENGRRLSPYPPHLLAGPSPPSHIEDLQLVSGGRALTDSQKIPSTATSANATSPPPSPIVLRLSDQDAQFLDFPDVPPVTIGGSCELYVAVHRPSNLKLAMKRPKVDYPTDDMLRRFRREAQTWSDLKHPHILPFFGIMKISHWIYIVSPWMPLGDLLAFVQSRIELIRQGKWLSDGPFNLVFNFSEARTIKEIATGLAYLHSKGIVHGDIKAKNILLTNEGSAQICDFGLTKTLEHAATSTELRGVGSIRWQSPELLHNESKSSRSDVYALGMTISEVLAGDYPFSHIKQQAAVIRAVVIYHERPAFQPLSRLGVDFEPLWKLAARCWAANADDRSDIQTIVSQLESYPARSTNAIHQLPSDLLQSIFLLGKDSSPVEDVSRFPFNVSHVCRSWRNAATKSPRLWSHIVFTGCFPSEILRLHVERSKGVGLQIEVLQEVDINRTIEFIQLLRPCVARWQSLVVKANFGSESLHQFFDELQNEYAPMLNNLYVQNDGWVDSWTFRPFSRGTPRLTTLRINASQVNTNSTLFCRLTVLVIEKDEMVAGPCDLTTQDLFAVIAQCASTIGYIRINAHGCRRLQRSRLLSQRIFLPHLQHLVLFEPTYREFDPSCAADIYAEIRAPEVEGHELEVSTLLHLVPPTIFPFPNLSQLTISQHDLNPSVLVNIPPATFIHVFSQLPRLQELKILYVTCFDHAILAHTCSRLQKLTLRYNPSSPRSSGVKDTIELRQLRAQQAGREDTLMDVTLDGCSLSDEEDIWLRGHLKVLEFASR